MSDPELYRAFAGLVANFAAAVGLPCAYPALGFKPSGTGAWLELQWFPNQTQNCGLVNGGPFLMQRFG